MQRMGERDGGSQNECPQTTAVEARLLPWSEKVQSIRTLNKWDARWAAMPSSQTATRLQARGQAGERNDLASQWKVKQGLQ